jgi:hypothetical protein
MSWRNCALFVLVLVLVTFGIRLNLANKRMNVLSDRISILDCKTSRMRDPNHTCDTSLWWDQGLAKTANEAMAP